MKLTDKNTITSKYEPKSKNVTWVDMSTGSPVMKKFINGMWRPVGSGGGNNGGNSGGGSCNCNLPEPSQQNNGQVLSVGHGEPTGQTTILPTTTLSQLENQDRIVYKITNAYNPNVFSEGKEICMTLGGNTFYSTIQQSQELDGMLCAIFDVNGYQIVIAHPSGDSNLYIEFPESIPQEQEEYTQFGLYYNEYNYEYMLTDASNVLCPTDIVYNKQLGEYYARFKNPPEAGKAYYIPCLYEDINSGTRIPIMLPCYIQSIQQSTSGISGSCIQLFCPERLPNSGDINLILSSHINQSMDTSANIYIDINGVYDEDTEFRGYYVRLLPTRGLG